MRNAPQATVLHVRGRAGNPQLGEILTAEGYEVQTVAAGRTAADKVFAARFQAAIVDLDPEDPLEGAVEVLTVAVKAPGRPAVLVSVTHPTVQLAMAAMRLGVFDILSSPVDKSILLSALQGALERRQSALELVSLRQVVEVFNSLQNLESTYTYLRKSIAELFQAQSCSLALLDTDRGEIVAQAPGYGAEGEAVPQHRFRIEDSRVSKLILDSGEPYVANHVPEDPLFEPARGAKDLDNLLAVAMRSAAGPVGFIYVKNRPANFSRLDADLLLAIGEQVGTALKSAHSFDAAYRASITDPLTDLYNRRFFDARLRQEVARVLRANRSLGLMFVDLDSFKQINDRFGHEAGNLVLTQISKIIRQCIRTADVPARWGGDEFTVLLTEAEPGSLEVIARRVRDSVRTSNWGPVGTVTATIGIAVMPQDAGTLEELLKAADEAMYLAKRRGKNGYALAQDLRTETLRGETKDAALKAAGPSAS